MNQSVSVSVFAPNNSWLIYFARRSLCTRCDLSAPSDLLCALGARFAPCLSPLLRLSHGTSCSWPETDHPFATVFFYSVSSFRYAVVVGVVCAYIYMFRFFRWCPSATVLTRPLCEQIKALYKRASQHSFSRIYYSESPNAICVYAFGP